MVLKTITKTGRIVILSLTPVWTQLFVAAALHALEAKERTAALLGTTFGDLMVGGFVITGTLSLVILIAWLLVEEWRRNSQPKE